MKHLKKFIFLLATTVIGCASTSTGVVSIGKDTYMLAMSQGPGTGIHSGAQYKAKAIVEANQYCSGLGKKFQIVNANQNDSAIAVLAKAEIQFMCLNEDDSQLTRPKLNQQADRIIEVRKEIDLQDSTVREKDNYKELIKLDDLLKKGILTDLEFQNQKKRLLEIR
jgi:hypothetical protein